ncbi:hypothetical protein EVAR_17604_1 [Eumeta japonica]|uniref:Histone-lysine N-methyltransferase SETMAR n=1 Tax=Eumeta variegata TaxID=151549 RepID=A0A4C1UDG7_EUMVA|nr:hypothetical protein EVAR_17604_1 [Eumeta japonica]
MARSGAKLGKDYQVVFLTLDHSVVGPCIRLRLVFHDEAPSLVTLYNWFSEFKSGRTNLTDNLHKGCSSTVTIEDISAEPLMIETDKRVTYHGQEALYSVDTSNFSEAQKLRRGNWCSESMAKFSGADLNTAYVIVVDDKKWIYCRILLHYDNASPHTARKDQDQQDWNREQDGAGPGSVTRIDAENKTMIAKKTDKKIG